MNECTKSAQYEELVSWMRFMRWYCNNSHIYLNGGLFYTFDTAAVMHLIIHFIALKTVIFFHSFLLQGLMSFTLILLKSQRKIYNFFFKHKNCTSSPKIKHALHIFFRAAQCEDRFLKWVREVARANQDLRWSIIALWTSYRN